MIAVKGPKIRKIWFESPIFEPTSVWATKCSSHRVTTISVLSIFSKILERTVYSQLMTHLETDNLRSEFQFGFHPNRSTLNLQQLCSSIISDEKSTMMRFLWIFLEISHSQLLAKLSAYVIRGLELHCFIQVIIKLSSSYHQVIITSFHCTQLVKIDKISVFRAVCVQRCSTRFFGPLLFVVFFTWHRGFVGELTNRNIRGWWCGFLFSQGHQWNWKLSEWWIQPKRENYLRGRSFRGFRGFC